MTDINDPHEAVAQAHEALNLAPVDPEEAGDQLEDVGLALLGRARKLKQEGEA